MIKLKRGEKPAELTEEVCEELKKLYAENNERAVWNSPKIKAPKEDKFYKTYTMNAQNLITDGEMWDTTGESDLQDADRLGNICRVTSVALFYFTGN